MELRADIGLPTDMQESLPSQEVMDSWVENENEKTQDQIKWEDRYKKWKKNYVKRMSIVDGAMQLIAGCYLWGGRKPPHITHKDGSSFDLRFGADTINWPIVKANAKLKWALPRIWDQITPILIKIPYYKKKLEESWNFYRKEVYFIKKYFKERFEKEIQKPISKNDRRIIINKWRVLNKKAKNKKIQKESFKKDEQFIKIGKKFLLHELKLRRNTLNAISDLMRVRLSGKDKFSAIRGSRIFRSFIRDILREENKKLLDEIKKNSGEVTDAEISLYEDIEKNSLLGTPHVQHTLSIQNSTIGHIAIILSGARQIVYSSPITHFRSIAAIRHGFYNAQNALEELKFASEFLIPKASFAFLPHNHHHHWHVEYRDPGRKSLQGFKRLEPDDALEKVIERLKTLLDFWLMIGIDMDPFRFYLKSLEDQEDSQSQEDSHIIRSHNEKSYLLYLLDDYNDKFKKKYPDNPKGFVELLRSRRKLHHVFMMFKDENVEYFMTPANPVKKPCKKIKNLMNRTDEIMEKILNLLRAKLIADLLEDVDETIKDIFESLVPERGITTKDYDPIEIQKVLDYLDLFGHNEGDEEVDIPDEELEKELLLLEPF